jgi:tellurite resistance protein TerC
VLPIAPQYDGARVVTQHQGRRMLTPMVIVFLAIGSTDLLFALDSIPAIFGLTQDPFIVFTATLFALMGLRQLYFLLGGLLDRLIFLSAGLAVILAFIGVKLIFEALHTNELAFVNGGEPVEWAPAIPIWLSLSVIVGVLTLTTIASLIVSRRRPARAGSGPETVAGPGSESAAVSEAVSGAESGPRPEDAAPADGAGGTPGTWSVEEPPTGASPNGHAANGYSANGHALNGHSPNGSDPLEGGTSDRQRDEVGPRRP